MSKKTEQEISKKTTSLKSLIVRLNTLTEEELLKERNEEELINFIRVRLHYGLTNDYINNNPKSSSNDKSLITYLTNSKYYS